MISFDCMLQMGHRVSEYKRVIVIENHPGLHYIEAKQLFLIQITLACLMHPRVGLVVNEVVENHEVLGSNRS